MENLRSYLDMGVPVVILCGLAIAGYRGIAWLAVNVALPVVAAHVQFLKAASEAIQTQTALLESLSEQLRALRSLLDKQREACAAANADACVATTEAQP